MSDPAWIQAALTAARPQALGALLRYFRDLDTAEEAFQDACLRALKTWPANGPPRDPRAWLIMVGRNAALDGVRRRTRQTELPPEEAISDLDDTEEALAERLDGSHYRDDILRLLPTTAAMTLRKTQDPPLVIDGPFAETKEQLLGFYIVNCEDLEEALEIARELGRANPGGSYEIRPLLVFNRGDLPEGASAG